MHRSAVLRHRPSNQIYADVSRSHDRRRTRAYDPVPHGHAKAGEELADPERLLDIVVGAVVQRLDLLSLTLPGGQDDDGTGIYPPRFDQDVLTVLVGKTKVQDDGSGGLMANAARPSAPVPAAIISNPFASKAGPRNRWIWGSSSMTRMRGLRDDMIRGVRGGWEPAFAG